MVSTVKTTAHHPFWDATDRRWVDAGELKPGHRLWVHDEKRLEGDGTGAGSGGGGPGVEVTVVGVVNHVGAEVMHNLTVADTHTYHVFTGNTPVLVHNNNDVCQLPGRDVDDGTVGRLEAHGDAIMESGVGKRQRPGTVGETIGVRPSGLLVVAQTQSGVVGRLPGPLFQALTACGHSHGGCSEVSGITRVFGMGATPLKTTAMGVLSKRIGREWHRKTIDPCSSCTGLLDALGMTWGR